MGRYIVASSCIYLAILTIIIFATVIEGPSILIVFVFSALLIMIASKQWENTDTKE